MAKPNRFENLRTEINLLLQENEDLKQTVRILRDNQQIQDTLSNQGATGYTAPSTALQNTRYGSPGPFHGQALPDWPTTPISPGELFPSARKPLYKTVDVFMFPTPDRDSQLFARPPLPPLPPNIALPLPPSPLYPPASTPARMPMEFYEDFFASPRRISTPFEQGPAPESPLFTPPGAMNVSYSYPLPPDDFGSLSYFGLSPRHLEPTGEPLWVRQYRKEHEPRPLDPRYFQPQGQRLMSFGTPPWLIGPPSPAGSHSLPWAGPPSPSAAMHSSFPPLTPSRGTPRPFVLQPPPPGRKALKAAAPSDAAAAPSGTAAAPPDAAAATPPSAAAAEDAPKDQQAQEKNVSSRLASSKTAPLPFRDPTAPDIKKELMERTVGEIGFQLDRRILSTIFPDRPRLYGLTSDNILMKIQQRKNDPYSPMSDEEASAAMERYKTVTSRLKPLGYDPDVHPMLIEVLVNMFGILRDRPEQSGSKAAFHTFENLRTLVQDTETVPADMRENVMLLLNCLNQLAQDDGKPLFLW